MTVGAAALVKEKLDIVELVGETVQLRKAGTTWKGLCPFHGEKTPSFTVTPTRETWKCFGCGRGGDIFNFVMERDGVDFATALRSLAGRAGIELSERTTREDAERKRLRDTLEAAIAFYHQVLTGHAAGEAALAYLHGRGFTDETIARHQLGFAPDAWDALTTALGRRRGIAEGDLERAGLASRRRSGRGVYDRFRGRVIFPIRDASGGATGLAGRILGSETADSGPKYLNSPADAAVRQEPHALPHRQGEGRHPEGWPRRARGRQHRRPDGAPGRLHERRVQHGHGADGRPGRAAHPLRTAHRSRV